MGHSVEQERLEIRRLVGYMPEHDCLPADTSAADFISWLGRCSGLPAAAARERSAEVLRHVGLLEERYRPMGEYSTGMLQRAKLAQALVHDPRLLILDEPTNGLDPAGRDEMLSLIVRTSRHSDISVLISSHLLGELERVCDAVVLISGGRLERAETLGDLTAESGVLTVEIEGDNEQLIDDLRLAGVEAAAAGQHVTVAFTGNDSSGFQSACDAIRDAVAAQGAALLRMERKRRQLSELFGDANV